MTLLELMITLAVVGVVATMAAPGMASFITNNRATTVANDMVGTMMLARSEAVTRGRPVTLCPSTSGTGCAGNGEWEKGWIVFSDANGNGVVDAPDDAVLRAFEALKGGTKLRSGVTFVTFQATGYPQAAVFVNLISKQCTTKSHKQVNLSARGRANVTDSTC